MAQTVEKLTIKCLRSAWRSFDHQEDKCYKIAQHLLQTENFLSLHPESPKEIQRPNLPDRESSRVPWIEN